MVYSDPVSVLHQLVQRRDVEFVTRNPLSVKLNCCPSTCTASGYITKHQKAESFAAILKELETHHKIVSTPTIRVVCPNRVAPCEFCSHPMRAVMPDHIVRRLPHISSVCGMAAVCQVCHYWTDGEKHFAVGILCCDQEFTLQSDSRSGLINAFETFVKSSTHYIDNEGIEGIHVKLHPSIIFCPLCARLL